jgi:hypothetical protein
LQQDPIYGAYIAYDMAVCLNEWPELFPQVFKAYDEDRVIDVLLNQRLIDNASGSMKYFERQGGYSLNAITKRRFDRDRSEQKKGPDIWRLRYAELYDVPITAWPGEAVQYALDDAQDTLDVGMDQFEKHAALLKNSPAQARAGFALQLMMCWGVKTDPVKIEQLKTVAEKMYGELGPKLVAAGLVRGDDVPKKQRGTRNVRAAQARMLEVRKEAGLPIRLTKAGQTAYKALTNEEYKRLQQGNRRIRKVEIQIPIEQAFTPEELVKYTSVDEEACKECGDELLKEYSLRTQLHNIVHTHVPDLLKGVNTPIQPSYKTMVESGRTACAKSRSESKKKASPTNGFQFQNPKRSLEYFPPGVGIRECFVARPKKLFADPDFGGLELCTGAQSCIEVVGFSKLAEALNAGRDPHLQLGARLMRISYEEAQKRKHEKEVKHYRQLSKVPNFALPGGLGLPGLMGFARGYGIKLSRQEAKDLREEWFEEFPEWRPYFEYIRSHIDRVRGKGQIVQLYVNRVRGGVTFTSASNTLFQGLGADGAKAALYDVAKHCYMKIEGSALYGARPVGFIHDEILAEVDENNAHAQAIEMAQVMVTACNEFLPDVPVKCEPSLSKWWSKDVEAVYDGDGQLQPFDLARDGKWKVFYGDGEPVEWKEAA